MQIIFGLSVHFLTAKTSPPYMHTARRKKRSFTGNSAPNIKSFFGDVFRKTRLLSRRRICIPQGARNTVLREKLSPNPSSFFGDVFSQNKENERRRTSVLQAKFDAVFGKLSPNLKSFFGDVFRKTRLLSRRCICIPQGARNAVLQETQPEPQLIFRRCFFARQGK